MRIFAPTLAFIFCAAASWTALSEGAATSPPPTVRIGYSTVADALAALRANPKVHISVRHGWTIAVNKSKRTIWAFVPKDDPAYPAVSKATPVERNRVVYVARAILCESSKAACDHLVERFKQLDERNRRRLQMHSNNSLQPPQNRYAVSGG